MQNTRVLVSFLIRAVVVGLAVAFLVVWWNPTLLGAHTAAAPMVARRRMPRKTRHERSLSAAPSALALASRRSGASAWSCKALPIRWRARRRPW